MGLAGLGGLVTGPHAIASVTAAAGQYVSVQPSRVVDSRTGLGTPTGTVGKLQGGQTWNITMTGVGGIPTSGVLAVAIDVTTANSSGPSYLNVWPTGTPQPNTSLLNETTSTPVENMTVVPVSDSGQVSFFEQSTASTNPTGGVTATDLLVDVEGYVTDNSASTAASTYVPLTAARVFDTRSGLGGVSGPILNGAAFDETVTGLGGVPTSGVAAVALNVGTVNTASNGYVSVWTSGVSPRPSGAGTVQTIVGQAVQKLLVVSPSSAGKISVYDHTGNTDVFADVVGYFLSPSAAGAGDQFIPVAPQRIVDTRANSRFGPMTTFSSTQSQTQTQSVQVAGEAGIPVSGAGVVAVSLTTLNTSTASYFTAYADGSPRPSGTSTIDNVTGFIQTNMAFVPIGSDGKIALYLNTGTSDVLVDVIGYFQAPTAPAPVVSATSAVQGSTGYVDWNPPSSDGGSAVTSYTVQAQPGGATVTTTGTSATFSGLTTGGSYTFTVSASNSVGPGPAAAATAVDSVVPTAPTNLSAVSGGSGSLIVDWAAPTSALNDLPSSLTGFTVQVLAGASVVATQSPGPDDSEAVFSGLSDGSAYTVSATATDRFGSGPAATTGTVIAGTPGPFTVTTSSGDGTLTASWSPSTSATSMMVTATPGGGSPSASTPAAASSGSATLTGLTNDTSYTVSLIASNAIGTTESDAEDAVSPEAAADSTATAGNADDFVGTNQLDTPTAVAVTGSTSGLSRIRVAADNLGASSDVSVINSQPDNLSALTGVVVDGTTGAPVPNSSVTIAASDGSGGTSSATADSAGVFAFSGIPATTDGTNYTVTVQGSGYGTYQLQNDRYYSGQTYQMTAPLSTSSVLYDASATTSPSVTGFASQTGTTGYPSNYRMPPSVKVAYMPRNAYCTQTGSSPTAVVTWSWRFYILHVAIKEITGFNNKLAVQANFQAESSYAWYKMLHPKYSGRGFDLTNTTSDQCFDYAPKIPSTWSSWIDEALSYRVAKSTNAILDTEYASGQRQCYESYFYNHNRLSQNGSVAHATNASCKTSTWQAIDNYYYNSGTVKPVAVPPAPSTSYSLVSGGVRLNFPSRISGYDVGWDYQIDAAFTTVDSNGVPHQTWKAIYYKGGLQGTSHSVPTSYTYTTSLCHQYRVYADNEAGASQWKLFAGGATICPS